MVEQVFQAGAEEVDHEDVVQAFLPEIVYIRNAGCVGESGSAAFLPDGVPFAAMEKGRTHGSPPISYTCGTRRVVAGRRSSGART